MTEQKISYRQPTTLFIKADKAKFVQTEKKSQVSKENLNNPMKDCRGPERRDVPD